MTNQEAIEYIKTIRIYSYQDGYTDEARKALDMAISALQVQEAKQETKKSRCTYKPDCPWYDGSKCNSPNDHGYHECDYDRGIFPESYKGLDKDNGDLQQTCNQLATDCIRIIRCKDCKQFRRWIDTDICFCDITEVEMSEDDFCSKAERRTDEND